MICNFEFLLLIAIMGDSPRDLMNADDEFISYGNVIGDGPILFVHLYIQSFQIRLPDHIVHLIKVNLMFSDFAKQQNRKL